MYETKTIEVRNVNVIEGRVAVIDNGQYIFSEKSYIWYLPIHFRRIDNEKLVEIGDLVLVNSKSYARKKVVVEKIYKMTKEELSEVRVYRAVVKRLSTFGEELDRWEAIRPKKYEKKGVPLIKA